MSKIVNSNFCSMTHCLATRLNT